MLTLEQFRERPFSQRILDNLQTGYGFTSEEIELMFSQIEETRTDNTQEIFFGVLTTPVALTKFGYDHGVVHIFSQGDKAPTERFKVEHFANESPCVPLATVALYEYQAFQYKDWWFFSRSNIPSTSTGLIVCKKVKDLVISGTKAPTDIVLEGTITLNDAHLSKGIHIQYNATIIVEGNNTIVAAPHEACLNTFGTLTIKGRGKLEMVCTRRGVCVGLPPISQSYGRYVPAALQNEFHKIVIDGVRVHMQCHDKGIAMGTYGRSGPVHIECINGGTLTGAPELQGTRLLSTPGETTQGSTKIDGMAEYYTEGMEPKVAAEDDNPAAATKLFQ